MSKRNYLGGLLGAQTSRQGSFTDPGAVDRYVPNVGMLSLGEAAVEAVDRVIPGDWGSSYTDTGLVGSDTVSGDDFGHGVAISGDGSTVVVGADSANKAYVFVDGVEEAILTPSTGTTGAFGHTAAISHDGSTIIIGVTGADISGGVLNSGAMYVYEKPSGGWVDATEDAILGHDDAQNNNDFLGLNTSVSDDGSVIAGYVNDKNASGFQDGAVLVYVRPGAAGTWASTNSYTAKLTASNAGSGDKFGEGLSVSGDGNTIACGAYAEDTGGSNAGTVYIYEKPGGGWATTAAEDHSIQGSNIHANRYFGRSCALNTDGTLLAVGASGELFDGGSAEGAVHVFSFNGTSWSEDAVLRGLDVDGGDSVAAGMDMTRDGKFIVATAHAWDNVYSNEGCLYVWERPSGGWVDSSSPDRLTNNTSPADNDFLGQSSTNVYQLGVSDNGGKIIAGSPQKGTTGNAILFDDGTVSASTDLPMLPWGGIKGRDVFSVVTVDLGEGWNWTETALVGSDISASSDYCGADSAMSGDGSIIVAGSNKEFGSNKRGKVYVFENGTQVAELTASDAVSTDLFGGAGIAVSNDGNTIAVGAHRWDYGIYTDGGAIYVYEKPIGGWANATEDARLSDSTQARDYDLAGSNISISGDGSTVVAASHAGTASLANPGAGIVYVRPGAAGTWANSTTPTATLTRSTRASSEDVHSVAISQDGSTIAVGFSSADVNRTNNGVVCIYDKPGGGWANATEDHVLQPGALASSSHYFGWAVSLSSDGTYMAAVSRGGEDGLGYSTAYLFSTNGTTWTEDAVLSMEDQADQYSESVAITSDGSRVIAGASLWDLDGTTTNCGCIYVWDKPSGGWADKDYDIQLTADTPLTNGFLGRNLYTSSNNLGITNDGTTVTAGYYKYNGNLGAVLELSGLPTPGNAVNVVDIADMTTTGILGLSDHYTALNRADLTP